MPGEQCGGGDTIHIRHAYIHDDEVGPLFASLSDGALTIGGFSDDEVAQGDKFLFQIETLKRIVIGNDDTRRHVFPHDLVLLATTTPVL